MKKHDRSSLRVLASVGEPINPEAWRWYYETVSWNGSVLCAKWPFSPLDFILGYLLLSLSQVGDKRCAVVDTWWQTETGGIMVAPGPWEPKPKPGAAMRGFPGVEPILLDSQVGGRVAHWRC